MRTSCLTRTMGHIIGIPTFHIMKKILITTGLILASLSAFAQQNIQPAVLAAPGGRFVFGQISSFRSDQYMLDTQTGRLWQVVVDTNQVQTLQPVLYRAIDGTRTLVPESAEEEMRRVSEILRRYQQEADKQKTEKLKETK